MAVFYVDFETGGSHVVGAGEEGRVVLFTAEDVDVGVVYLDDFGVREYLRFFVHAGSDTALFEYGEVLPLEGGGAGIEHA